MTMTDPVSDLLNRIRNAHLAKHDRLETPISKLRMGICELLQEQGYIERFEVLDAADPVKKRMTIYLRYTADGSPVIRHLQRVSRPGRRVYRAADKIRPVLNGHGVGIVSTSQGLLTDKEARKRRIGGEILCEIW